MLETPLDIVIVDDDESDIDLFREHLQQASFRSKVRPARNGAEALGMLREGPLPDLVLLDINMPGMDGLATLEAIRSDPGLWHLRVMVLTTSATPQDMDRSFAAHADAFVTKPSDVDGYEELVTRVHDMAEAFIWQG